MNLILFEIFVQMSPGFFEMQGGGQEGLSSETHFIYFPARDRPEQGSKQVVVIDRGHVIDGRHVLKHDFKRDSAHGPS